LLALHTEGKVESEVRMKGLEGTKLGRYELLCRIAQGGMSEIYLGFDRRVRRRVAVKVLYGSDEAFVRRFEHEAVAIGTLSHDHILPLYDFGVQRPWYYLVMPFVEGGTLRDYLLKCERFTLEEAGSFLYQIASALQHAHDHGVIHRDVKPSNILLRLDGHAYLVDFGLAKAKVATDALSHVETMIGTPEYMAPEQSNNVNDHRSDIYSLGIILYQMLTGHVPFTGDTPVAVTLKHLQTPPTPPRQLNSNIPQSIEDIILKALAKQPDQRYQQANDFSSAYRAALQQEWIITSQAQSLPIQSHNHAQISDKILYTAIISPISTQPLYPCEIPDKYRLFPLDYDEAPIPAIEDFNKKNKRKKFLSIILFSLIIIIIIPLGLFWQARNPSKDPSQPNMPTKLMHWQRKAVEQAKINSQATLAAQARVQATVGITSAIGAGKLLYYDDMVQSGGGWINDGKQCYFSPQGYHVSTHLPYAAAWCYTDHQRFSNAVISVQAQLLHGDFYGLIFRLNPYTKAFYVLEVNSLGQYRFQRSLGRDPSKWLTLIDWTYSNTLVKGYKQTNTLLVMATDGHFRFYINQQLIVPTFTDTTYSAGLIGLLVGGDSNKGTEAIFRQICVFQK
jgi:serine/threonine protein kinase